MVALLMFMLIQKKKEKLDAKAVKCFFIGYGSYLFGYRFRDDKN